MLHSLGLDTIQVTSPKNTGSLPASSVQGPTFLRASLEQIQLSLGFDEKNLFHTNKNAE